MQRLTARACVASVATLVALAAQLACAPDSAPATSGPAASAPVSDARPAGPGPLPLTVSRPTDLTGTVAFQSDRAGRSKLFTVDLATGAVAAVTSGRDHHDVDPAWSPDGRRVAFSTTRFDSRAFDLAIMNADGTNTVRVAAHGASDRFPAWSADGQRLFYAGEAEGTQAIYTLAIDSPTATRVSRGAWRALHPAPAPDGLRLAYVIGDDSGLHVVVQDLTTGAVHRLDRVADEEAWPAWSLDGTRLAVTRMHDGASSLAVVTLATDAITPITIDGAAAVREPAWSPDGRYLVATATAATGPGADWDLVLVRLDPPAAFRLTSGSGNDTHPAWAPR